MKTLISLIVLGAAFCGGAAAAQDFAKVDGTAISVADYESALAATVRQKFYHRAVPEAKLDEFSREVAEALVERVLLLAEARRRGIVADTERVARELAGYESRYASSDQWKQRRDQTLPGLKKFLEERDVLEQLQSAGRAAGAPSEEELAAYYAGNPELFTEPEQVRLSLLLLKVDPSSPAASWALAAEEAQAIRRRLQGGADFRELARLHSTHASAAAGGDMGYLHEGRIPEPLFAQLGGLQAGEVSEPIRLLEGVALVRLEERRAAKLRPLADVRSRASQLWQRAEAERRWRDLVARLRAAAKIEIDTARYPALAGLFAAAPGAARTE